MDDLTLKKEVEAELQWEPSLNAASIGVAVKDGIVTLTGRVSSYAEKMAAARRRRRVAGVKAVANDIEVRLLPSDNGPTRTLPARSLMRWLGIPPYRRQH